ncbi:hypothetical protein [Micromonospora purpureochromogenes]|uniref:DUF3558 domain-containing protein n=1 Tax=Micromonospora purpureochromogenes TaxID=47872 RepID=A0ABX2RDA8_9ACTN|nr:hypothetical protein [Micromonospora purpureochromogenes]NYF54484.1 hypothetical protein [Micromonospora purpureochromogenes]
MLIAASVGFQLGYGSAAVDPSAPPSVCGLVRPAVLDILVPGHGALTAEEAAEPGWSGTSCRAEGPPNAQGASLFVALTRYGRNEEGEGPRCADRPGALTLPVNRTNHPVPIGDVGTYFFGRGDQPDGHVVHLSSCLGTYGVYVRYEARGVTAPAIVAAATTVAREVLASL